MKYTSTTVIRGLVFPPKVYTSRSRSFQDARAGDSSKLLPEAADPGDTGGGEASVSDVSVHGGQGGRAGHGGQAQESGIFFLRSWRQSGDGDTPVAGAATAGQ